MILWLNCHWHDAYFPLALRYLLIPDKLLRGRPFLSNNVNNVFEMCINHSIFNRKHSHSQHFNNVYFTTTLQLLMLNLTRSRNNVVKISQRIDRRFTLRLTPYWKQSSRILAQSTNSKSLRGRVSPLRLVQFRLGTTQ